MSGGIERTDERSIGVIEIACDLVGCRVRDDAEAGHSGCAPKRTHVDRVGKDRSLQHMRCAIVLGLGHDAAAGDAVGQPARCVEYLPAFLVVRRSGRTYRIERHADVARIVRQQGYVDRIGIDNGLRSLAGGVAHILRQRTALRHNAAYTSLGVIKCPGLGCGTIILC